MEGVVVELRLAVARFAEPAAARLGLGHGAVVRLVVACVAVVAEAALVARRQRCGAGSATKDGR